MKNIFLIMICPILFSCGESGGSTSSETGDRSVVITEEEYQLSRDLGYYNFPNQWTVLTKEHPAYQIIPEAEVLNYPECTQLTIDELLELYYMEPKRDFLLRKGFYCIGWAEGPDSKKKSYEIGAAKDIGLNEIMLYGRCLKGDETNYDYNERMSVTHAGESFFAYQCSNAGSYEEFLAKNGELMESEMGGNFYMYKGTEISVRSDLGSDFVYVGLIDGVYYRPTYLDLLIFKARERF